jgi:AcrR family transcriptional regulator
MPLKNSIEEVVEYKGKRTQRSRGHERREAILRAALQIIARDGMRAVRHRAVAKEANVPLAATTYYFKDINELIYDAFAYFAAEGDKLKAKLEERSFAALSALTPEQLKHADAREQFLVHLTELVTEHIYDQVDHSDDRRVENSFHMRALYDNELSAMLAYKRNEMRPKISRFFSVWGLPDPESDTEAFLALVLHLEYETLSARLREDTEPDVRRILKNFLSHLLNRQGESNVSKDIH